MPRLISFVGLLVMIGLAWLMSSDRKRVNFRIVGIGVALQILLAVFFLWSTPGLLLFQGVEFAFHKLSDFVREGTSFIFRIPDDSKLQESLLGTFALGVLPTIIVFSSFMSVLYYFGIMQLIVRLFAVAMHKTLGVSGAESLSAAANIFVGHTEAPLVIRPYINTLTRSELNAVMVGGFATISGGLLAAFDRMGISAGHLVTASIISAPAALVIAKILQPEAEVPETLGTVKLDVPKPGVNVVEAAAAGASEGMKLAVNVAVMLLAFLALLAMVDFVVTSIAGLFGAKLSLASLLGYAFCPLAWLLGIEWKDCLRSGELLGLKMVTNEVVAYQRMSDWIKKPELGIELSQRTQSILTYALSGFSNIGAIGIQIGGIGGLAPGRRADLAQLGFRAMLGGALACCMTACVAGILLP